MDYSFLHEVERIHTLDEFADLLTQKAADVTGSRKSMFFLLNRDREELTAITRNSGKGKGLFRINLPLNEDNFVTWPAVHREPLLSNEVSGDSRYISLKDKLVGEEIENLIAVPMLEHGRVAGVILVVNNPDGYNDSQVQALQKLLEQFRPSFTFVRNRENLDNLLMGTGEIVQKTVDFLTPEGSGHVMRVVTLCSQLATLLDLSEIVKQNLLRAAVYHDVGKILLAGRQPWEIERLHPATGADFIRNINVLKKTAPLIEVTHERYDGTGFPKQLSGDVVPLEGWVLALAEDLEEFNHQKQSADFESMIYGFYSQKAASHHPEVTEALTALINQGKIEKIIRE